jgi:basic amino acid/polyamine antiporter, APA family
MPTTSGTDLRRAVTTWGSYSWGYADVGADIYVALGLVVGAAMGAANIAFLFAGIVYVCIGLAYTELSAAYPVAGGGQFFVTRALGDFVGFIAGWAVLLDFTVDIAIFAWATIAYVSILVPWFDEHLHVRFGAVVVVTAFLTVLNVIGVRQSSRLNELVAAVDICNESLILVCGFLFAWHPQMLVHTMAFNWPQTNELLLGTSLAIISFVGLESIAQAAEETHRPSTVMPRTSVGLILTILIFALAYSNLVLGMPHIAGQPAFQYLGSSQNNDRAVALLAASLPIVGNIFKWYVPIIGALLVMISSNSGVYGASRIAYSMGKFQLLPSWFQVTNPKTKTPTQTILFFSTIATIILVIAYLQGPRAFSFLGDLYAFGAALSYTLVFVALMTLRFTDAAAPRRFRMPWNIPLTIKGVRGDVSLISIIGFLGIASILIFTLITHPTGRIAGPSWVIFGILFYAIYRHNTGKPLFSSIKRNWTKHHQQTLANAGELEMLDEYNHNLKKSAQKNRTPDGYR